MGMFNRPRKEYKFIDCRNGLETNCRSADFKDVGLNMLCDILFLGLYLNKADRHKSRAPSIQRRTDRPTNSVAYRVACTQLKMNLEILLLLPLSITIESISTKFAVAES